jgi:hypothetical protein
MTSTTTTTSATSAGPAAGTARQAPPAGPRARLRALLRGRSRSTTPRILFTLLIALLAATVAVLGTGLAVVYRGQHAAEAVRTRAVPAISGVVAARTALVQADAAAMESFDTGARLVGPGEHFYNQIAIAVQGLTRAAGSDIAGESGNRKLRTAAGLLTTYTRLVQQAAAHPEGDEGRVLRARDLYSASQLLHDPNGGVLAQLDDLLADYVAALRTEVASGARHPAGVVPWLLATLAVVALLAVTLVFFARRFRRLINVWLVAALALVAGLTWTVGGVIGAHDRLQQASDALVRAVGEHRSVTGAQGQQTLYELIRQACGEEAADGCGGTVAAFADRVAALPDTDEADDEQVARRTQQAMLDAAGLSADAGEAADRQALVYALAALIAAAGYLGFRPRLNEYRFRSR